MIFVGPLLGALLANLFGSFHGPRRLVVGGLAVLALLGLGLFARNRFRRTWAPVGNLIDATQRLGDGESGVRIPIAEPGPLAAVSGSFNRMASRLEEEDQRRRRLLADLSHELRTPLTVIRGEIEAVLDGLHDPQSLSHVVDEVDLMERLLEDLRVLTLTEAGRLQLHRETLDIEILVSDVITSFATLLESHGVVTTVEIQSDLPEIEVDHHRLRQVLANLISNAAAQMPEGGSLRVQAREEGTWLVIEVSDTGPGIPEDRLERVFERFVKSGDSSGTGLGLSIARDLVEAHGGNLDAANRPEGGARFSLRLPT
jgi:signal transduction histidine kinase